MSEYVNAFIVNGEAWYTKAVPPGLRTSGVMIQRAHRDGGVAWEFRVDEHDLGGKTLQLHMFADSWQAFAEVPELFSALREQQPRTLAELRAVLVGLGFYDLTERVQGLPVRFPEEVSGGC